MIKYVTQAWKVESQGRPGVGVVNMIKDSTWKHNCVHVLLFTNSITLAAKIPRTWQCTQPTYLSQDHWLNSILKILFA